MMIKESNSYRFDLTVIVITYNSNWNKLAKTLDSILIQKRLCYEIIVCDDGSDNNFHKELEDYFLIKQFTSYRLILHDNNHGTVSNFYSGLKKAEGKYSKLISPGDYFVNENILYEWIDFLENNDADWSFSNVYCYYGYKNIILLRKRALPQIIRPYKNKKKAKCVWNYLVANDRTHGAAVIGTTQRQLAFCKLIKENGVIYAEDGIWDLMMFWGIIGCYYPRETIFYEYGTGISTSKLLTWKQKLSYDMKMIYQIMVHKRKLSNFQKKIIKAKSKKGLLWLYFCKGTVFRLVKWHFFPRLTKIPKKKK